MFNLLRENSEESKRHNNEFWDKFDKWLQSVGVMADDRVFWKGEKVFYIGTDGCGYFKNRVMYELAADVRRGGNVVHVLDERDGVASAMCSDPEKEFKREWEYDAR